MTKGPFWLSCGIDYDGNPDFSAAELLCFPVPENEKTPSHRNVWEAIYSHGRRRWNDFPRGRVEVRRGRAIVFANPLCFLYDSLESELRRCFDLGNAEIVWKTDNSAHYACLFNRSEQA